MARRKADLVTDDEPEEPAPEPERPAPLSPTGERLLFRLMDHLKVDQVLRGQIDRFLDADWQEIAGGIEASDDRHELRVDNHEIVLTTKPWNSKLRVALR